MRKISDQTPQRRLEKLGAVWCTKLSLLQTRKLGQTARTFLLPLPAWQCELINVDCDAMWCRYILLRLYLSQLPPVNYSTSRLAVKENYTNQPNLRSPKSLVGPVMPTVSERNAFGDSFQSQPQLILSSSQLPGPRLHQFCTKWEFEYINIHHDPRKQASCCLISAKLSRALWACPLREVGLKNCWTGLILGCCQSSDIAELEFLRYKQRTNDFAPANGTWEFIAYRFREDKS